MTIKVENLEEQSKQQEAEVKKYRQMVVKQSDEFDQLEKEKKKITLELQNAKSMVLANQSECDAALAERDALR